MLALLHNSDRNVRLCSNNIRRLGPCKKRKKKRRKKGIMGGGVTVEGRQLGKKSKYVDRKLIRVCMRRLTATEKRFWAGWYWSCFSLSPWHLGNQRKLIKSNIKTRIRRNPCFCRFFVNFRRFSLLDALRYRQL